jgi:hypothetical protein
MIGYTKEEDLLFARLTPELYHATSREGLEANVRSSAAV